MTDALTEEEREELDRVNGIEPDLFVVVEKIITTRVAQADSEMAQLFRALPHDWREQYERAQKAEARIAELETELGEFRNMHLDGVAAEEATNECPCGHAKKWHLVPDCCSPQHGVCTFCEGFKS